MRDIITIKNPKSPIAESYRTLRTNLQFSSLDKSLNKVVVTSSGPGEGKSTTSINLAVTLAQNGHKTIIIDCDMRKPSIHKKLKLSNQTGLSNILIGENKFDDAVNKDVVSNLDVVTSGTRPPNPAELLSSRKMLSFLQELEKEYEYIIIDTPPVLMVTDAQVLSKYADGTLLVVASGEAEKDAVKRAKELLDKVDANLIGVVLNKLDTSRRGYYGYYYQYYYGQDNEKTQKKKKGIFFNR